MNVIRTQSFESGYQPGPPIDGRNTNYMKERILLHPRLVAGFQVRPTATGIIACSSRQL